MHENETDENPKNKISSGFLATYMQFKHVQNDQSTKRIRNAIQHLHLL